MWNKIKYSGKTIIPDIEERYLVFRNTVSTFGSTKGCEFYKYYCFMLRSYRSDNYFGNFYLTTSDKMIKKLKNNYVSPTSSEGEKSKRFLELKNWGI